MAVETRTPFPTDDCSAWLLSHYYATLNFVDATQCTPYYRDRQPLGLPGVTGYVYIFSGITPARVSRVYSRCKDADARNLSHAKLRTLNTPASRVRLSYVCRLQTKIALNFTVFVRVRL